MNGEAQLSVATTCPNAASNRWLTDALPERTNYPAPVRPTFPNMFVDIACTDDVVSEPVADHPRTKAFVCSGPTGWCDYRRKSDTAANPRQIVLREPKAIAESPYLVL